MQNLSERQQLAGELEGALRRLESAFTEAGLAIATIRNCIPQISTLVEVVDTMESAMTFVRQRLGDSPVEAPLRALPQQPPQPAPEPEPEPRAEAPVSEGMPATHCLRLRVGSKIGALDLKAVDNAVNEQQTVTDVALIDYDGRQATLRVWIAGTGDAEAARRALGESLRSRLGDTDAADIDIEFDERAAA